MSKWTFFTNYGHVIFLLSEEPQLTTRDIASRVGITERAVQKIIHDLEEDGFIKIRKSGRNNIYKVVGRKRLRHEIEKQCRIEDLCDVIQAKKN